MGRHRRASHKREAISQLKGLLARHIHTPVNGDGRMHGEWVKQVCISIMSLDCWGLMVPCGCLLNKQPGLRDPSRSPAAAGDTQCCTKIRRWCWLRSGPAILPPITARLTPIVLTRSSCLQSPALPQLPAAPIHTHHVRTSARIKARLLRPAAAAFRGPRPARFTPPPRRSRRARAQTPPRGCRAAAARSRRTRGGARRRRASPRWTRARAAAPTPRC